MLVLKLPQPYLIGMVADYVDGRIQKYHSEYVYLAAMTLLITTWINIVLTHNVLYISDILGLKVKAACNALIYEKVNTEYQSSVLYICIQSICTAHLPLLCNDFRLTK